MYSSPVNEHDFLLRCVPQERPEQRIVEMHLDVQPLVTGGNFGVDSFGNRTYTGRLPRGHTTFSYRVQGIAIRDESRRLPCPHPLPVYSYPSTLTRPSETLRRLFESVEASDDDLEQAERFRVAVYEFMTYKSGVTNVQTTAADAALFRAGVCQDFTHIFLALCRMKHIPARYVSGIPVGEGAAMPGPKSGTMANGTASTRRATARPMKNISSSARAAISSTAPSSRASSGAAARSRRKSTRNWRRLQTQAAHQTTNAILKTTNRKIGTP